MTTASLDTSPETGSVYDKAHAIARIFNCRVAIVHNGNDGPGRVWEAIAEANTGGFPSATGFRIHDVVNPPKAAIRDALAEDE